MSDASFVVSLFAAVPAFLVEEGRGFVTMTRRQHPYGDWEFEVRDPNGHVPVFGGDGHLEAGS